jgi:arabinose-5-phosphate isomerase
MNPNEWSKKVKEWESKAISNIPDDNDYDKAMKIIYEHVHQNHLKSKVICSGMGKAGQVAHNIATTFSSTGTAAVFLHPAEAQHGDLGIIQPNDILLFVSNSGMTREVLEMKQLADNLYGKKLSTILITGKAKSTLSDLSDVVLRTGDPKEVCPLELTPTTSMTTMMVIGDILICIMMDRIKFTKEDYSKRHHGGYLGKLSKDNCKS